jgi:murein DD-endopeptidase MepM/ murein hydrolase activator NlpD
MIKFTIPFKGYTQNSITQGFSNVHKAIDFTAPYGTWLVSPFNCIITKIVDGGNISESLAGLESGYGVRMVSTENPKVSVIYWHCLGVFPVKEGDIVVQGKPVAQMANSGFVLANGQLVPIGERLNQPYKGVHCHCSVNIDGEKQEGLVDYRDYIDYSIKIEYDLKTVIASVLQKIINLIK